MPQHDRDSVRPTRYDELGYQRHAPDLWRVIDRTDDRPVGPHYKTRAELLADLDRYAKFFGCDGADAG